MYLLSFVAATDQIVKTDVIIVGQFDCKIERQYSFPALILGIKGLIAQEDFGNLLLCQVSIFAQVPDSEIHHHHQSYYNKGQIVLLTFWTICPILLL